ncbi:MAG: hypothetical protein Fur0039_18290 [Rhodocyclaceae bacterium]
MIAAAGSLHGAGAGRICPVRWSYPAKIFAQAGAARAEVLYVAGGLYGNSQALAAIEALAAREPLPVTIAFNGDFHWFDVDAEGFERIDRGVAAHVALLGNVEAALGADDEGIGCGCAYPAEVAQETVARSNRIHARLRRTALRFPAILQRLARLPMHGVFAVGPLRVAVVHGDAGNLAGWRFDRGALEDPSQAGWLREVFREAEVDVFASSHTCAPVCRVFATSQGERAVINNGAAGMPNFAGTRHGLITRIAASSAPVAALYGLELRGVRVEAIPLEYDACAWERAFLANWPEGSDAHASYGRRILRGPDLDPACAAPRRIVLA